MKKTLLFGLPIILISTLFGQSALELFGASGEFEVLPYSEELLSKANAGDVKAQVQVGIAYYEGLKIERNNKKAVEWFMKSAEQKSSVGEALLAMCYKQGDGVTQDFKKAFELFQKSAKKGDLLGQFGLGVCYTVGEGVPENKKEGLRWLIKAADLGSQPAIQALNGLSNVPEAVFIINEIKKESSTNPQQKPE
ncbi:MAG: sel1 repeat family protein [Deltaproteobacteria bacterium]|nr:sel1 repeat family protein [Deltaproteobacteria bacterium]